MDYGTAHSRPTTKLTPGFFCDRCKEEAHLKQVVTLELLVSPFEEQLDRLSQLVALQGGVLGDCI